MKLSDSKWTIVADYRAFDRLEQKARDKVAKVNADKAAAKAKAKAHAKAKAKAKPVMKKVEPPMWQQLGCKRLNNLRELHEFVNKVSSVDHMQCSNGKFKKIDVS